MEPFFSSSEPSFSTAESATTLGTSSALTTASAVSEEWVEVSYNSLLQATVRKRLTISYTEENDWKHESNAGVVQSPGDGELGHVRSGVGVHAEHACSTSGLDGLL